jgi:tRNA pseudouridine38-40 synthase
VIATIHSSEEEEEEDEGPKKLTKKRVKEDSKSRLKETDSIEPSVEAMKGEEPAVKEEEPAPETVSVLTPLEMAVKDVKTAYITAKKAYRISASRRQRVQEALDCYIGTRNFHNYTIQKSFSDPSAKRVIRSFKVGAGPIIINNTEWLSLKVHGQSFMMHQIRKMVAMAALVVRCGTSIDIIRESYGPANISIPKAPGLGLLLERPVFDSYNERASREYSREKLDFDKYQKEMDEFKQREIYDRIFREEEKDHQ